MPASTAVPESAATTKAGGTSNAGSSRRCDGPKSRLAGEARSWRRLLNPAAGDVQEYFLQGRAVVSRHDGVRTVVVLDPTAFHDDDPIAQPLDLEHVVGGHQNRRLVCLAVSLQMLPDPVRRVGIE